MWGYTLTGELTTAEGVTLNNATKNVAYYTPDVSGVSYITATTKDGKYSVNFAVVCTGVKAESLDLDTHNVKLEAGETYQLVSTLSPVPTLDSDKELIWTSFNPKVATVEDGVIIAKSAGYAFIKVTLKTDTTVSSYCIVTVTGEDVKPIVPPYEPGTGTGTGTTTANKTTEPELPFTDVSENASRYDAVKYVYDYDLMNGTSDTQPSSKPAKQPVYTTRPDACAQFGPPAKIIFGEIRFFETENIDSKKKWNYNIWCIA